MPFQIFSHRRLWVDWKRGAAAMWMPSYYSEWVQRMSEVGGLKTSAARLDYACAHHIDYILEKIAATPVC